MLIKQAVGFVIKLFRGAAGLGLLAVIGCAPAEPPEDQVETGETGFVALFDGVSFQGWQGNRDHFRIQDGAIVAGSLLESTENNQFLCTEKEYGDFELRLKVKLLGDSDRANAGIQIRSRRMPDHHEVIGYQADMGQRYWGSLYDESRRNVVLEGPEWGRLASVLKNEDWNDYVIRCQGRRVQLWINGLQTVDYIESDPDIEQVGVIGLQIHSGPPAEAHYRDIRLKILSPVSFRPHVINSKSRFEAASAFDVNNDGVLDIFCGGFWYQAPEWERHFVRDVPEKDEYHYDFANLPLDVNGDGWTDVINAAWHSETLFWLRNPGHVDRPFDLIEIDKPGNMETAILVDINGDALLDILPAVNRAPAWYESSLDSSGLKWTKRDLPSELKGHGIGAGDIDGNGTCDLVGPLGWLSQATSNEVRWSWHPEFELGSASIPILVYDVDGDGDSDMIWGSAHDFGLQWMEQVEDGGKRSWSRHYIDRSWSQVHFLVLVDLDQDGQKDVITGKRYRAHNGKDPGSRDPLCIYWYRFDPKEKVWSRHTIHEGGMVGFGINTTVIDLDQDGDLDVVAPGKSGLYLLENMLR